MNFQSTTSNNTNNSNRSAQSGSQNKIKYIYDLPFIERKEITRIFDENNQWETLGGVYMGFSSSELSEFGRALYRGASPTESLLTSWGNQNHTILELFILFAKFNHFRGMKILAKFVDSKYHKYIRDTEFNATEELIQLETNANVGNQAEAKPILTDGDNLKLLGDLQENKNDKNINENKLLGIAESGGLLPQIPYEELLISTANWERKRILGKGGFGTVFKGFWKNTFVAIKRMEHRANHAYVESQMKQSLGELKFLNTYRHDNILPLYGYSLEGEHPCLVYQFLSNGSLEDRLILRNKTFPLSWMTRYHIARGVACGIQFLHSIGAKPLIHGDIKSANILLDRNFEPKIGDFGLAREMSSGGASYVKVSRVHGTRPYLPSEYLRSKKLSTKVDTFSFGIMLFEISTGQRAYDESRSKKFLKDIIDESENYEQHKDIKAGHENPDVFWILVKLGINCTHKLAKERPEMVHVLKSLDELYSQASIRTISSVPPSVTSVPPFLFETPNSRLSHLLPTGFSTTPTPRLSPVNCPEMRAGSPWIQGGTGHKIIDSSGTNPRKSPLPSNTPSPQPYFPAMNQSPIPECEFFRPIQQINNFGAVGHGSPDENPIQDDDFIPRVLPNNNNNDNDDFEDEEENKTETDGDDGPTVSVIPMITELLNFKMNN